MLFRFQLVASATLALLYAGCGEREPAVVTHPAPSGIPAKPRPSLPKLVTRPYPICYFNNERITDEVQSAAETAVVNVVKEYSGRSETPAFSPDHRWVVVKATEAAHAQLASIWPEIGCIGRRRAESELVYYRRCVEHLKHILATREYDSILKDENGIPRPGYLNCDGGP